MKFTSITLNIFILSLLSKRANSCDYQTLPVVDLSAPDAAVNLVDAFQYWGFSYIKGHNVDQKIIQDAEKHTKKFFQLPSRVKRQLQAQFADVSKTTRGYTTFRGEQLDPNGFPGLKEVLDVGFVNRTGPQRIRNKRHYLGGNKWPANGQDFQKAIKTYAEYSAELARKVLQLLADGLGVNGAFDNAFNEDALQVQRLTNYPPSNEIKDIVDGQIGSGVHSDYGGITVLYANGPGLEILRPDKNSSLVDIGTFSPDLAVPHNDEWIKVESRSDSFIVMGGEALQRLSNGCLYAVKHKVGLTGHKSRHSLAFFLDPRPDALLEPIDGVCSNRQKKMYKGKMAGHKGVMRNLN